MKLLKPTMLALVLTLFFACEKDSMITEEPSSKSDLPSLTRESSSKKSFLVLSKSNEISKTLKNSLAAANGNIQYEIPEVGIAVVQSDDPNFAGNAAKIIGVQSVVPNLWLQRIEPAELSRNVAYSGNPPVSGDDDFFFDLQWGHDAIDAPEAWDEGYKGAGVSVGILDTGFDLTHPDLQPNINMALSKDFTGQGLQYTYDDRFSHGTHTAGTVGAADNGFGTIGVAPEVELVLIKVLYDEGYGYDSDILNGIVYAAQNKVDVINMSFGVVFKKSGEPGFYTAKEAAQYTVIYNRVLIYAHQQGTTLIAAAGNDSANANHTSDWTWLPAAGSNVIAISATGPNGWGLDPETNLDLPAFYTNYGQSLIDLAAPGGTIDFDLAFSGESATVAGLTRPAYVFDFVFSTGNGGWYWSIGTSMASPHAVGVAALIIGKNGGSMNPAQVKAALKSSADDLGEPDTDAYYGGGRVNALRAISN